MVSIPRVSVEGSGVPVKAPENTLARISGRRRTEPSATKLQKQASSRFTIYQQSWTANTRALSAASSIAVGRGATGGA